MAGRLSFAAQRCFNRVGREMVRPFFAQQYAPMRGSRLSAGLRLATEWWLEVFRQRIVQHVPLTCKMEVVDMFCDARSNPARMAAVLVDADGIWYTDWAPSQRLWQSLKTRKDKQIMAWELLAMALGTSTFASRIRNKRVRVWCDNVGAE